MVKQAVMFTLTLFLLSSCRGGSGGKSGTNGNVNSGATDGQLFARSAASTAGFPACDSSIEGNIYYDSATNSFHACSGGSYASIDVQGPTGASGATGPQGPQGPAGSDGVDGSSGGGAAILDSSDNFFGWDMGNYGIVLSDGAFSLFQFRTGNYYMTRAYGGSSASGITSSYCMFTSNDCTGTCIAGNTMDSVELIIKDSLYSPNGTDYYIADGTEPDQGAVSVASFYREGQCYVENHSLSRSFSISTVYLPPAGITFPPSAPLRWGTP